MFRVAICGILSGLIWTGAVFANASPLPGVTIEGRYLVEDEAVLMGFPGHRLSLNAPGPVELDIERLGGAGQLDVRIDEGDWDRVDLAPGRQTLTLGASSAHRLTIIRRNEDWQGRLKLYGVKPVSGQILSTPTLPNRKLLFIGDSITAGSGTDVAVEDRGEGKPMDNGRLSFARVLGDRLNSQVHQVAYGGRGVMRDWQGIRETLNAPDFYERAVPSSKVAWDHSQWVPDAIIIGLGTNDFNVGIPDQVEFVRTYVEFIRKIRRDAPDAPILLINSPMTGDDGGIPKATVLKAYLDEVADKAGPHVHRANTDRYIGRPSVVGHPTDAQHKQIADELEPVLRKLLGP